jgi:hypothetical protein
MKKVMILAVAVALLGISAPSFTQVPGSSQPSSTTTPDDKKQDAGTSGTQSGTQSGTSGTSDTWGTGSQSGTGTGTSGVGTGTSGSMSQYNEEVKISELPSAITEDLNEKYPGFKTDKAFKASDGSFKVTVSNGDEKQNLFFDENGKSISKMHDASHSQPGTMNMPSGTYQDRQGTGSSSSTSGTGTGSSMPNSGTVTQPATGTQSSTSGTYQEKEKQGTGTSGSGTSGSQTTKPSSSSTSGSGTGTSGTATTTPRSTSTMSSGSMSATYNKEVKTSELPAAVTRSLNEKYPGYKTDKAFKADDGTYKVSISKGDEKQTLFFDERGESVKMQK